MLVNILCYPDTNLLLVYLDYPLKLTFLAKMMYFLNSAVKIKHEA